MTHLTKQKSVFISLPGGRAGHLVIRRSLIRIPGFSSCMSKYPLARYLTQNCYCWAVGPLHQALNVCVCVCVCVCVRVCVCVLGECDKCVKGLWAVCKLEKSYRNAYPFTSTGVLLIYKKYYHQLSSRALPECVEHHKHDSAACSSLWVGKWSWQCLFNSWLDSV